MDKVLDTPGIVAIANSASYAMNSGLVRGELISLFGFGFGESPQVLIDDLPASVVYSGANQINVQVPFERSGIYYAQPRRLQVVSTLGSAEVNDLPQSGSLGLFTTDGVHAAALNQDGTINTASNPAASGSIVTLFGTGASWPSGTKDGCIATSAVSLDQELNKFLMVDLSGTPMNVLYAGTAPGLLYGLFQLNVQLPSGVAQPLTLTQLSNPKWQSTVSNSVQIYLK